MRRSSLGLLVLSVTLVLAGCSGHSGDSDAQQTGAEGSSWGVPNESMPSPETLPFTQYEATIIVATSGQSQYDPSSWDKYEESISTCMKNEGFDYFPQPYPVSEPSTIVWAKDILPIPVLPLTRAEVVQYGYGIDDVEASETARLAGQALDENGEYYEELSATEKTAYDIALTGSAGEDPVSPDPEGGCGGQAASKFWIPLDDDSSNEFMDLINSMQRVAFNDVFEDPDVLLATEEWTSCMADAGYVMQPPAEYQSPRRTGPTTAFSYARWANEFGEVDWSNIDKFTDDIPIDERYIVGSSAEREIAVADFDCRESSNYVDVFTASLIRLENDFILQNSTALDHMTESVALNQG